MSKANALLNGEWGKQKKKGKKHTSKKRRAVAKKILKVDADKFFASPSQFGYNL